MGYTLDIVTEVRSGETEPAATGGINTLQSVSEAQYLNEK